MMNIPTSFDAENLSDTESKTTEKPFVKKTIAKRRAKATEQQKEGVALSAKTKIYDTIVVGAGISGIATAHKLQQVGYDHYVVLEKASRVGGTWRENTYPGCGCDVPSALYSFSFAPSYEWSNLFAKQPEILNYLEKVVQIFQLQEKILLNHELLDATWQEKQQCWKLQTSQGEFWAKTVVFGTGPITEPSMPKLKGIESFQGEIFHSARWNHDYDLTGKRVAVIGTGASAIQFVPQIQPLVKQLYVFQRTAPWVLPKADMTLNSSAKSLITQFPQIQRLWRGTVAQILNGINFGLRHPQALAPINFLGKQLLKLQIQDHVLREAVTPNFDIGCKRLLFANNYYPALQQSNTDLIPHGLVEVQGNTLIASNGQQHEVDVIIWGTGFEVSHPPIGKRVRNNKGQLLSELWKNSSPEAYLGASIADVPNAFLILGPNILVYDSFIGIAEAQVDYIVSGLLQMKEYQFTKFNVKPKVIKQHNEQVQKHLQTTVFNSGGCKSYYLDENGKNFAAWPWSLATLKSRLKQLNLKDYDLEF